MDRSPTMVTGTVRNPRAISSPYAEGSSSTFLSSNSRPARERNSFTRSQARQLDPEYTMMRAAGAEGLALLVTSFDTITSR